MEDFCTHPAWICAHSSYQSAKVALLHVVHSDKQAKSICLNHVKIKARQKDNSFDNSPRNDPKSNICDNHIRPM